VTNIFVLGPIDLPILAALWATKTFIPGRETEEIKFMKRFPQIKDVKPNDLFVGCEDSLTKTEKTLMNGRMLETFPAIMKKYATETDRIALEDLTRLIKTIDPSKTTGHALAPGASRASQSVITHTGLEAVLDGLKALYLHGGDIYYSRMTEIFEGLRKSGRNRIQIQEAAEKTPLIHDNRIAITTRATYSPVHMALFQDYGVSVIIFSDGYNLGVLRHPKENIPLDHPSILEIIKSAGEAQEWGITPSKGLLFRGTSENRKLVHSRVNKHKLADALASLLDSANHGSALHEPAKV
jgi:hypothetical protein